MYTVQSAAELLGVSDQTVKRWMKRCAVEGTRMEIDGKIYLSDSDLVTLASYQERKTTSNKGKTDNNGSYKHFQDNVEKNFYSVRDAALFLGVSVPTVKNWMVKANIKKKMITTNKRRLCISQDDIFKLADSHRRRVTPNITFINFVDELNELRDKFKVLASNVEDIKHDLRILGKRAIFIR